MNKNQLELHSEDIPYIEKPNGQTRLRKEPEHFISKDFIADVNKNGLDENRRGFLRKGFLSAIGGAAGLAAAPAAFASTAGDPAILEKQEWQTTLGKNVATMPYGLPSVYESNLIRNTVADGVN